MTGDDLAMLLRWLYADADGRGWLPAAAADLRLNTRRLRAMMAGTEQIPFVLDQVLPALVAAHCQLNGWAEAAGELHSLGLSKLTLDRIIAWQARF